VGDTPEFWKGIESGSCIVELKMIKISHSCQKKKKKITYNANDAMQCRLNKKIQE